ncbi:MAG: NACHT and WD repeat domain-containing protein, partial [Gaiellaceae bacterium]
MSARTLAPESPYKGLRPFEATDVDARLFFGRERERELIAANLTAARLTVLYGESGVGKSSVLRAGVVHSLRQDAREGAGFAVALYSSWSDEDPIDGIAEAVREAVEDVLGRDPGAGVGTLAEHLQAWSDLVAGEIFLVLDQVDEYFLYHGAEGGPLLDELPLLVTEPGLPVNVLLGIREDSLARLDVFKARIPSLFGNYLRLERLGREAARAAIVGPLQQWSRMAGEKPVTIEPSLVDTILDEVAVGRIDGNGSGPRFHSRTVEPPYLQIVLERIWEAERSAGSSVLRLATLEQLGGARRIVSEHLDHALAGLAPVELDAAAAMFTHLVTPSGAKIAHGVGDLAAYAGVDEAAARNVASALVEERILRPVEGSQGEGARVEIFHDVLAGAVAAWGREHEAARALDTQQAEARRKHRRLLALAVAALIALAAMTVVAVYAVAQQREADDQRAIAAAEADVATSREHAAQALIVMPTDPIGALKLAARAAAQPSARTEDVLRTTLVQSRQRASFGTGADVLAAAFSPDGTTIAFGDQDGRVVAAPPLGPPFFREHHGGAVNSVAFADDGRILVTGSDDSTAAVWDLRRGRRLRSLRHGGDVKSVAVSPDGRLLATGAEDRKVRVWGLPSGRLLHDIDFLKPVERVSFSSDGKRVLAVGGGQARLFDIASGGLVGSFDGAGWVTDAALSYDGELVATGHRARSATGRRKGKRAAVRLWNARGGQVGVLVGHTGTIRDVEFDPLHSLLLVSASADGSARVWNVAVKPRRQFIGTLIGHENLIVSARFSPGGKRIVTASADRTAAVWKVESNNLVKLVGHRDTVLGAEMSVDGRYVLTWGEDGTARVWDWNPDPVATAVGRLGAQAAQAVLGAGGKVVVSLDAAGFAHVKREGQKRAATLAHPGGADVVALS